MYIYIRTLIGYTTNQCPNKQLNCIYMYFIKHMVYYTTYIQNPQKMKHQN